MKQAETARTVYREDIKPTLHGRQLFVRAELHAFCDAYGFEPTALELVRYIGSKYEHQQVDVNTVRPRLTEMEEQGWVSHAGKKHCSVSGKRVYTWQLSTPRVPLPEPIPQRLNF